MPRCLFYSRYTSITYVDFKETIETASKQVTTIGRLAAVIAPVAGAGVGSEDKTLLIIRKILHPVAYG